MQVPSLVRELRSCLLSMLPAQSCLTLCNSVDQNPPGSFVYGIFQTRYLEWVAISSSRGSLRCRDRTWVSCVGRWILYHLSHQGSPCLRGGATKKYTENWLKKNSLLIKKQKNSGSLKIALGAFLDCSAGQRS